MIPIRYYVFLLTLCVCEGFSEHGDPILKPNNPDESNIIRPCGAVYDVNCVRQYFYEHSKCKKTYGPVPDPIIRPQVQLYVPRVNITFTIANAAIGGLNGRIDEFYINKDTNNLVLTVELRNMSTATNNAHFRFHRRGKEPVVTRADDARIVYSSILITVVIPNLDDLQLDRAEYFAYVNDSDPPFYISPSAAESTDPQVPLAIAEFISNITLNLYEIFLNDSAFYAATFIQHNICDFGLKIL